MNDYQEYRSYGSYLSRVFAIIIAFLLLVFAIWGVVRLANNDDGTLGDTNAPSFSDESSDSDSDQAQADDPDLFVSGDDAPDGAATDDDIAVSNDEAAQDAQGQTLSTNTDIAAAEAAQDGNSVAGATTGSDLPSTGAGDFTFVLAIGAFAFIASKLYFADQK